MRKSSSKITSNKKEKSKKEPVLPIVAQAIAYADDIIADKITACIFVKQACQRFKDDLKRSDIVINTVILKHFSYFLSKVRHLKGKTAKQEFILSPYQAWIVVNVLGLYYTNGKRKYSTSYIETARKSGKTFLTAAMAMFEFMSGYEPGAEVLMAASTLEQAGIMFKMCKGITRQLDPKKRYLAPRVNDITFDANNSLIKCLPAEYSRLDGYNASFGILDEVHAHPDSGLYDVLKSSMAMRQNPHIMMITTAGFNLESFCYNYRKTAIRNLSTNEDDRAFVAIYTHDTPEEWLNPEMWIKSNPNLGVTVEPEFLKTEQNRALKSPSELVPVKTKNFNYWMSSMSAWLDAAHVNKCLKNIEWGRYESQDVIVGLDLSSTMDMTALAWVMQDADTGIYRAGVKYYLPEQSVEGNVNSNLYRTWAANRYMTLTPGNVVDYDYVFNDIMQLSRDFRIVKISYDKWNAIEIVNMMEEQHLPSEPFSQAIGNFNAPTKALEKLIMKGAIEMDNNPILSWNFSNVNIKTDYNMNSKPVKADKASAQKIDGVIAILMALGMQQITPVYSNTI